MIPPVKEKNIPLRILLFGFIGEIANFEDKIKNIAFDLILFDLLAFFSVSSGFVHLLSQLTERASVN